MLTIIGGLEVLSEFSHCANNDLKKYEMCILINLMSKFVIIYLILRSGFPVEIATSVHDLPCLVPSAEYIIFNCFIIPQCLASRSLLQYSTVAGKCSRVKSKEV